MGFFMKMIGNPFMKMILLSPLHPLMSKSTTVISVTGKKSGNVFTFPVNYQREGDVVWITSMKDRRWWRNLRGGAKVTLRLEGSTIQGWCELFEGKQEVENYLREYLLLEPDYAKDFSIGLNSEGSFEPKDLAKAAENRVMIKMTLS